MEKEEGGVMMTKDMYKKRKRKVVLMNIMEMA
jgi:hypothetical protein